MSLKYAMKVNPNVSKGLQSLALAHDWIWAGGQKTVRLATEPVLMFEVHEKEQNMIYFGQQIGNNRELSLSDMLLLITGKYVDTNVTEFIADDGNNIVVKRGESLTYGCTSIGRIDIEKIIKAFLPLE